MDGWIKSWRKILKSRVFRNPDLLKVWVWCLHKASHAHRWVPIKTGRGETEVEIQPGQFIFGRNKAADELHMKPSSVRGRMEKLKDLGNIAIQPDTHFSVVTICNWLEYQKPDNPIGQATGQATDNQGTGNGQPRDTDKKVKKVEKDKKTDALFDRFWVACPRKVGKKPAMASWGKIFANGSDQDPEALIVAMGAYAALVARERRTADKILHPTSWLNQERWNDELPGPDTNAKPQERVITDADHAAGW